MSGKSYIVRRGHETLVLSGPFQYPAWSSTGAEAMSHARAVQCSAAFGGEVVPVGPAPSYDAMPKAYATPPPATTPSPFGTFFGGAG